MGCDIHLVVECRPKAGGKWIGLYSSHAPIPFDRLLAMQRDYAFFGEIAEVRGTSSRELAPKGLPDDASDLTTHLFDRAVAGEYHAASHLTADEFLDCWLATREDVEVMPIPIEPAQFRAT